MAEVVTNLRDYFVQYTFRQRLLMIGVIVGIISSTITLVLWANRPEYELLYSDLPPEAASSIVDDLRAEGIKYKLENSGRTIYVPKEFVSEWRLKSVQSGYIKDGISGYEVFDNSSMGMTTFMQRLNMKRAMEGEITRTLLKYPGVKACRVHLVIPESRLFEEQKQGKASVVLELMPGVSFNEKHGNAIASVVASSVEGIEPENVVVSDVTGKVLVDMGKDTEAMGSANNQWELQNSIESKLQKKVYEIVASIVGDQNAVVKVTAKMNFDQVERTTESVDPDNVVVLSEETYSESSFNVDDSSNFKSERSTANYELSKKQERFVSTGSKIERLTVAVSVNGHYEINQNENGEKQSVYVPRSEEELQRIAALVKSAVGFSEDRGDIVEVQNFRFSDDTVVADQEYFQELQQQEMMEKYITYGLFALAVLLGFFLVRTLLKSSLNQVLLPGGLFRPALATGTGAAGALGPGGKGGALPEGKHLDMITPEEEAEISEDFYMAKLSPEARAKLKAKDKMTVEVVKFAKERPEDASKLIRSWLATPSGGKK